MVQSRRTSSQVFPSKVPTTSDGNGFRNAVSAPQGNQSSADGGKATLAAFKIHEASEQLRKANSCELYIRRENHPPKIILLQNNESVI